MYAILYLWCKQIRPMYTYVLVAIYSIALFIYRMNTDVYTYNFIYVETHISMYCIYCTHCINLIHWHAFSCSLMHSYVTALSRSTVRTCALNGHGVWWSTWRTAQECTGCGGRPDVRLKSARDVVVDLTYGSRVYGVWQSTWRTAQECTERCNHY